jgi:hypothetical protein
MSFENEDVILPDDFAQPEAEQTEEVIVPDESVSEEVDTLETEQTEEQPTQEEVEAFLKIKYNKEEVTLDQEKARELAQMGMNYPKIQEQLESLKSDPRLSFVEELASENGMSVDEFLGAFQQQKEQQRLNDLIQQNIPEDLAREILENRKFREEYGTRQREQETQSKQEQEFNEFFEAFPNVKADEIPKEVWDSHAQGVPLRFAFMQHDYSQLKSKVKVLQKNDSNLKKAPVGSVTNYGSTDAVKEDDFLKGFNSI